MEKKEYSLEIGGKTLTAEFNDWADQANGSVLLRYGNSAVLATAVMGGQTDKDYFPLTVEYEEKFYAVGAILGSRFVRREGRPSDEAVLSGRIVDRTIRPLFPKGLKREVQVVISVISIEDYDTDILAVNAASLALATSDIPWNGPVSAVRIGVEAEKDDFIVNPTYGQRQDELPPKARMDLTVSGRDGMVNMIEVNAREVSENVVSAGLLRASEEIEKIQAWQKEIVAERGAVKQKFTVPSVSSEISALFETFVAPKLAGLGGPERQANGAGKTDKRGINGLKSEWMAHVAEKLPDEKPHTADGHFEQKMDEYVHELAIKEGRRVDGRALDEIRHLFAQAGGISPIIHGTGLFYRGQTHVLAAVTLGGPGDSLLVDTIEFQDKKKTFMLHYNFPPFSVGEAGRVGGFNRRQIGHGALAEKSLRAVLPPKETFPYTVRIVADCLASNGSTSMASVCAGTIALMDAGVPITRPVAGIAMGMMSDAEAGVYKVLTDIQGPEDHHGDMDFKVAGTSEGITGVQMDVKVDGVPLKVLNEAFEQAKKARLQILEVITKEISAPRADISPRAPKILTTHVQVDQIGLVIGPGGKTINGIKDSTKCDDISIEEDGTIFITGKLGTAEAALKEITDLTREYQVGERFDGEVTRMMDFGAFVKIGPNTEGLVHVSEVAPFRIDRISDALKVGDVVPVVLKEIDEKGRYNLSIKAADPEFAARKGIAPSEGGGGNYGRAKHGNERRNRRF
ncbi:polyribonucleotide nucleotidyltransferase [Candidatus Kaiserbacteria bacterium RIFCSPHIGHO2_01_FULL_50_13]|uniref:Polyribonucleotide nucleotidyltransferase n=1 Tax=Candidatus Kaiserbacteria bacterium RIFCSPLOWO2_01_FULL_50_24 TaxID=1798507 RepID=A0A1F6ERH7_9BACT|nr:MAG: polyribonucleotide nucleotidyltransferase [Candidatus Kaiserbacteria bacterium RIFCSPHIGHO2_01_FULL_50_13]OGG76226.1 MAG: polyribonucleotide nucleotidyltransferase [Candidatus Kaiserbacteria bacterium RIFCSPLOWO2_01_FULL_50_24]OGG81807.1 MAG: polyribonucleotide nucleotidyltransferase [Candidatus Kaiserbacteria bacterium RIFCSPLOWO2_02_FULL_51_13]